MSMKVIGIIVVVLLCVLLIVIIVIMMQFDFRNDNWNNNRLQKAVIAEINRQITVPEGGEVSIDISELTNFEWDEAVIFRSVDLDIDTTNESINVALGIDYKKPLNHRMGIIFTKDCKVVYEEIAPTPVSDVGRFSVVVVSDDDNYTVLSHEDAVLIGRKVGRNGKNYYALIYR